MSPRSPPSTLFPYTTLFRSHDASAARAGRTDVLDLQPGFRSGPERACLGGGLGRHHDRRHGTAGGSRERSEEHTSELQSLTNLVCRLLLEKKKRKTETKKEQ